MKAVKLAAKLIAVISFTAFFACSSEQKNDVQNADSLNVNSKTVDSLNTENTKVIKETKPTDYTAKYICPMHCPNSGSDKMGDCPNCGMELIENPTTKKVVSKKK